MQIKIMIFVSNRICSIFSKNDTKNIQHKKYDEKVSNRPTWKLDKKTCPRNFYTPKPADIPDNYVWDDFLIDMATN